MSDKISLERLRMEISEIQDERDALLKRVAELEGVVAQSKALENDLSDRIAIANQKELEVEELLNATHSILEQADFTVTAKRIFDACARTIGARAGYVALLSDDGSENELLFLEDGGMPCTVNPELPMPIRGLREQAYRTGKVAYDNEFMKSEWVKFMPKGHMALRNVLFSPLNIEGKTVGIMGMACKDGDFNDHDARLAAAFGEYAAIALMNSWNIEKLKDSNDLLGKTNNTKDKILSIISHDLITPLNSIAGLSEVIYTNVDEGKMEDIKHLSGVISRSAKHNHQLLFDLLQWSRAQSGEIAFNPIKIVVNDLFAELNESLSPQANSKNVTLDFQKTDETVCGDKSMLVTVLKNLISNAVKFSFEEKSVNIRFETTDSDSVFIVRDFGVGMDSTKVEEILHSDKVSSVPGTSKERGTGFGHMIIREFLEMHKGSLQIDSEVGKGSEFKIVLPKQAK